MAKKEFDRLSRLPPITTVAEAFYQSGPRTLVRFHPVHVESLTTWHVIRLQSDIASAFGAMRMCT